MCSSSTFSNRAKIEKKKSIFYLDVIIKRSGKRIIKKRMKKRTAAIMFWVIEEGKKMKSIEQLRFGD